MAKILGTCSKVWSCQKPCSKVGSNKKECDPLDKCYLIPVGKISSISANVYHYYGAKLVCQARVGTRTSRLAGITYDVEMLKALVSMLTNISIQFRCRFASPKDQNK